MAIKKTNSRVGCKLQGPAAFLALTLAISGSNAAQAQSSGADSASRLEEIIVTALKRDSTLQETAISVSALTGEHLERMGADTFADYVNHVPGLYLRDNGPGQRRPIIRGVQGAGESQVGLYYDEVPVSGTPGATNDAGRFQPDIKLFDIERIEVLRGPQGTLYGAGSVGGTLRIITRQADPSKFEAKIAGDVSSTENGGVGTALNGMINIPLVDDELAFRLVAYTRDMDGFIDNLPLSIDKINEETTRGARGSLRWSPTANFDLTAVGYYQDTEYDGGFHARTNVGDLKSDIPIHEPFTDEVSMFNLTANWGIGEFAELVASTSYFDRDVLFNFTLLFLDPDNFFPPPPPGSWNSPGAVAIQPQDVQMWSHEIRLSSYGEGRVNWTVGGFLQNRETFVNSAVPFAGADGFEDPSIPSFSDRTVDAELDHVALFGEVSFDITDRITLTGGLRYFDIEVNNDARTFVAVGGGPGDGLPNLSNFSEDDVISKLHIAFDITDNLLLYAQRAEGFRAGGANQVVAGSGIPPGFGSDSLVNYEIGLKGESTNRRLQYAGAIYHIIWDDIQVENSSPDGLFRFTDNAGEATIDGIEFELNAYPSDELTLGLGLNWNDARLTENQPIVPGVFRTGLDGDTMPAVPDWTANLAAEYIWSLSNNLTANIRGDLSYTGEAQNNFRPFLLDDMGQETNVPDPFFAIMDDYVQFNVRAGISGEAWFVGLFADNVFDERGETFIFIDNFRPSPGYTYYVRPRTVGISFALDF